MTPDQDLSVPELRKRGDATRRAVMGSQYVDTALEHADETSSAALQDYVTTHLWGGVWSRPELDFKSRSLITLGILIALRSHHELEGHTRAARRNGLSKDEITEVVLHAAGYCGVPAALAAMRTVQHVFDRI